MSDPDLLIGLNFLSDINPKIPPQFCRICTEKDLPYICTAGRVHFQRGWTLFRQHTPSGHTHILWEQIQTFDVCLSLNTKNQTGRWQNKLNKDTRNNIYNMSVTDVLTIACGTALSFALSWMTAARCGTRWVHTLTRHFTSLSGGHRKGLKVSLWLSILTVWYCQIQKLNIK